MNSRKTILLGVCGSIAAYKAADLTSRLVKAGYNVFVILTAHATEFVAPLIGTNETGCEGSSKSFLETLGLISATSPSATLSTFAIESVVLLAIKSIGLSGPFSFSRRPTL